MSSIDLIILGILLEKPQSAYDIQKDVDYHHFSRWAKVSVPSIYKKVLQLKENGYLKSETTRSSKFAEKAVYSITETGKEYFEQLMDTYSCQQVPLLFDFNVVITNLNKMEKDKAINLIDKLRNTIKAAAQSNADYAIEYTNIPLVGKTIFEQQRLLYLALLEWLDTFEIKFKSEHLYDD